MRFFTPSPFFFFFLVPALSEATKKESNPIASAITLVREQLVIVDDMIENHQSKEVAHKHVHPNELKNLRTSKAELERQIGQLLLMARSEEEETKSMLKDVTVRVLEPEKKTPAIFDTKGTLYTIECQKKGGKSWTLAKNLEDFITLHNHLKDKFPKVEKLGYILQKVVHHVSDRRLVKTQMESFLQVLLSDEVLVHSDDFQLFLDTENLVSKKHEEVQLKMSRMMKDSQNRIKDLKAKDLGSGSRAHSSFSSSSGSKGSSSVSFSSTFRESEPSTPQPTWKQVHANEAESYFPAEARGRLRRVPSDASISDSLSSLPQGSPSEPQRRFEFDVGIAIETTFALTGEIFDLHGSNLWLQRQAFLFLKHYLQQGYKGKLQTIFMENAKKLVAEDSVLEKLDTLRTTFFPNGKWAESAPARTPEMKAETKKAARAVILRNIPELFSHMVGRYNAVCGMTLVFDLFQHQLLNKQLLYNVLDVVLNILILPEPPIPPPLQTLQQRYQHHQQIFQQD